MEQTCDGHAPQLRVLSDGQIDRILAAALECLARTGVEVRNAEGRALLGRAGAHVDGTRVRIPARVIEAAVASAPRSFTLWGRDGARALEIGPDRAYFGPGPTCTYFIDPQTGERRPARRGDPALTARVCDALDNIDYVMGLGLISDVTPVLAPVYEYAEMVANTTKPVLPWAYSADNVALLYDIAVAVAGSRSALRARPILAVFATFHPPLVHTDEDLSKCLWAVEHGLPVVYLGGGKAGLTAPITGAGLLVTHLAGALSGLAIMQLKAPGSAVCVGGVPSAMDLRTARPAYGSPETSLYSAAMRDITRRLGLPYMGTAGASESKILDLQAAIESTVQVVISALSGVTLAHDVGFLDCANIGSLEALVMNDEIISLTRRLTRGIAVDDAALMLDVIDRVGPAGHFAAEEETAHLCRSEIWQPTLMDRRDWDSWQARPTSMHERIRDRLHSILTTHEVPALPEPVQRQIDATLRAAEDATRRRP